MPIFFHDSVEYISSSLPARYYGVQSPGGQDIRGDRNGGECVGLRTVRNTGTAVINTVQTGKNQTETGRSFFLGNSKRVGSGLKRVPTPVDGRFLVSRHLWIT